MRFALDQDTGEILAKWKSSGRCVYGAPYVAIVRDGKGRIGQSCCNHWDCPCCGQQRARQEYGRIVQGATELSESGHQLYFLTLTCLGKEIGLEDAEANYLHWTNRLLTALRYDAGRIGKNWSYVQVTERQKRGHPHSHIITSYCPEDAAPYCNVKSKNDYLHSDYLHARIVSAGLGVQWSFSKMATVAACSRYVAKYLFKSAFFENWPKGWKRVRYSQNWPKLPENSPDFAMTVSSQGDWKKIGKMGIIWHISDTAIYEQALHRIPNVVNL